MYTSIPIASRVTFISHKGLAVLLILLFQSKITNSDFIVIPQMSVVGAGATAIFTCRHQSRNTLWLVNGTVFVTGSTPTDITTQILDGGVNSLNIVGKLEFNETLVQCGAFSTTDPLEVTPNVTLLVQGSLNQVSNITRALSTISWIQPFSLNLTNIEPDIIYCVEVYNITCGRGSQLVSDCNVTESRLVDGSLQSGYIYRITITPRSNVESASNGTSLTKEESFTSLTDPRVIIMIANRSDSMVAAIFQFRSEGGGVEPASYSLNLTTIDEIEELALTRSFTQDTSGTNLSISEFLPRRRLWNYEILALGCIEHPATNLLQFSTHDVQNVFVSSPSLGQISVTGDFINGSSATSILAIIYSTDNRNDVFYFMINSPSTAEEKLATNISGLPFGLYNVSIFVLEENGLPFNRSATTPRNVSVRERGEENGNFLIEYEVQVQSTSTDVCITCTFLDNSATDCVAVVHQRISQLSSSGLMNIKSSHQFTRSGDTAYGCIEGVNLEQYQIGVMGGRQIIGVQASEDQSQSALIAGITCIVVSVITVVVVVVIVFTMRKKIRERQVIHSQEQERQPGDSSSLKPLTTPQGKAPDEEAYDVLRRGPPPKTLASKQEFEGGVESTAMYSVLDKHPPQRGGVGVSTAMYSVVNKHPPKSGVLYSSVNLGSPSGTMIHEDLHKTTRQYSELQQQPQEESSFNEGAAAAGSADIRCYGSGDTTLSDLTSGFCDELVPSSFCLVQGPTVARELTTYMGDQKCVMGEAATTLATQCTDAENTYHQIATCLLVPNGKHAYVQGHQNLKEYLHPVSVMTRRSCGIYTEYQRKDAML